MRLLRTISRGVAALVHRRRAESDVTDELRHYHAQAVAEYERRGLSTVAATRAATLEMGNLTVAREQLRSAGWEHAVDTFVGDVHYALRRLRRSPGFTATAIVTLALGIGASTTVFSVVSPILLEPLPFPHASELVTIDDRNKVGAAMPITLGTFVELQTRARSFAAVAVADNWRPALVGSAEPEQLHGQRVTSRYFDVYGVRPVVGRTFTPDDEQRGAASVVILSDALVRRRFGGDRSILGRTIELDGVPHMVVGVMSPRFTNVIAPAIEIWAPLRDRVTADWSGREWGHHYKMLARLAPGATLASAERECAEISRAPIAAFARPPWANLSGGLLVASLQDDVTGPVRPSLLAILGAVAVLLVIAAVNVTNLLLARGSQRRTEIAMRLALGASRRRIVRQLLTESLVLALVGGVVGVAVALVGVAALVHVSPPGLPRVDAIHVNGRVLAFTFVLTALVGLVVGTAPALGSARGESRTGLHGAARPRVARRAGLRDALVVSEVALAIVLLVGGGLMYGSVTRLMRVPSGFDPAHVVTMQVVIPGSAGTSDSTRLQFFAQAVAAVQQLPGVASAAFTSQLPLSGDIDGYGMEAKSLPSTANGAAGSAMRYSVTADYFASLGVPLRAGRLVNDADRPGAPVAVVINESLAQQLFEGGNPIGEQMRFGPEMDGSGRWATVVGVVGDVKHFNLAAPAPNAFYVMNGQWPWTDNVETLVVRATGDAAALVPAVKRAIWSVNPNRPIQRIQTMESIVAASADSRRFVLLAIEAFAVVALILAAVGLYGVIAGSVMERLREIGIRAAMGAAPSDIVRAVVARSLAMATVGVMIGVPFALAATRLLRTMLFEISPADAATYGGVIALIVAVAGLAAWAPARRAAGVDPTVALRAE